MEQSKAECLSVGHFPSFKEVIFSSTELDNYQQQQRQSSRQTQWSNLDQFILVCDEQKTRVYKTNKRGEDNSFLSWGLGPNADVRNRTLIVSAIAQNNSVRSEKAEGCYGFSRKITFSIKHETFPGAFLNQSEGVLSVSRGFYNAVDEP